MKMILKCSHCNFKVSFDLKKGYTPTSDDYTQAEKMMGFTVIDGKHICRKCNGEKAG